MDSFDGYLPNLLTPKEVKLFQKRYRLVQLLKTNLTYREIAQQMGISTTTVVRLNQRLKIRQGKRKILSTLPAIAPKVESKEAKLPWKFG
jgi:uncharacterized protein YerC